MKSNPPLVISSGPPLPLPAAPLSPSSPRFASLRAAPPHLSPLLVVGVVSPRLPFPSTIWTLIPPLLTTSAQVFLAEGMFFRGWWVFFPLPRVRGEIEGVLCCFCLGAITFMSPECSGCWVVLLFLLFFCVALLCYVISLCSHERGVGRAR
jgi:hypothetical protein